MTIRDVIRQAFAKPVRSANVSEDRAAKSPGDKERAEKERALQLQKLDRVAKTRYSRMFEKERRKLLLQKPEPALTPVGARRQLTDSEINKQAHKNVKKRVTDARAKIETKSVPTLLSDADKREKSEQQKAKRADERPNALTETSRSDGKQEDGKPDLKDREEQQQGAQRVLPIERASEADRAEQIAALERTPVKPVQDDHLALEDTPEEAARRQAELDAMWAIMEAREDNDYDLGHER